MGDRALVAAINWNGAEFICPMIESLLPQLQETGTRLLVFDNGSTDGSPEMVENRFGSTGLVTVERHLENIGFGPAANRIIEAAAEPVVVLVNTDTVVKPGCLSILLNSMDTHQDAAFIGPKLLWPDGSLQRSRRDFPFPFALVKEKLPFLKKHTARYSAHDETCYTDWLIGAMMAVRKAPFMELGGFSEDFLFFHEETDLQYRMWEKGWKVLFEPSAEVYHHEGGSCRQVFGDMVFLQYIPGKLVFLDKHGTKLDVFLFRFLMSCLQLFRLMEGIFLSRWKKDIRVQRDYCKSALELLWRKTGR